MIHAKSFVSHNWERLQKISLAPISEGRGHDVVFNFGTGFSFVFTGSVPELKALFREVLDVMEENRVKVIDWPLMIGGYIEPLKELCLILNSKPIVVQRRNDCGEKVS